MGPAGPPATYLVRTSWVVGDGKNFVRTMASLAERGIAPKVVADQTGRLTFTTDLAAGIIHLLSTGAEYGTYNLSGRGPVVSWCDIARRVYELVGRSAAEVTAGDDGRVLRRSGGHRSAPAEQCSGSVQDRGHRFPLPHDSMERLEAYVPTL